MPATEISGPLPPEQYTQTMFSRHHGTEYGIRGDTDGSAFGITLPPSGDEATFGSATIDSICKVGGYPLIIEEGAPHSLEIPPALTGGTTGRTDLVVARYAPATYTTAPGPVRLFRIAGTPGSPAIPAHNAGTDLPLWGVCRKQGEALNQAISIDMRSWTGVPILVASGAPLPLTAPLGSRATRDGITYRRGFVSSAVDWIKEWLPVNAVGATVYDTGWINLSLTSGWKATTGQTPQVRRIGTDVCVRGRVETISGNNASGSITPCFIPDTTLGNSCKPPQNHDYVQQVNVGGGSYRIWVGTDGTINTLGFPAENNLYIATSYLVN